MDIGTSTVSGDFALAPTSIVTETQYTPEYEITVTYSVTPEENYAGPPAAAPPPPTS